MDKVKFSPEMVAAIKTYNIARNRYRANPTSKNYNKLLDASAAHEHLARQEARQATPAE